MTADYIFWLLVFYIWIWAYSEYTRRKKIEESNYRLDKIRDKITEKYTDKEEERASMLAMASTALRTVDRENELEFWQVQRDASYKL